MCDCATKQPQAVGAPGTTLQEESEHVDSAYR